MAPEQEAPERAFYDHESDERTRRRRPAADWGVGEDIFDRMPSRRFKPTERRPAHQEVVLRAEAEGAASDVAVEAPRRAASPERRTRRPVESWLDDDALPLVRGESRTIVLSDPEPEPETPTERRTVKISGHPDRLPVPRAQRAPRTAIERIGTSPDRIAAYAVALGFLLVLIAVLTTGQ